MHHGVSKLPVAGVVLLQGANIRRLKMAASSHQRSQRRGYHQGIEQQVVEGVLTPAERLPTMRRAMTKGKF
jgi:hypothetical protein